MNDHAAVAHREITSSVTPEVVRALAQFRDDRERAVSFYFSLDAPADNSHHREALLIKQMVREILSSRVEREPEAGLLRDLNAILAAAEEIRTAPSRLTAIFACGDHQVWHEFNLPASGTFTSLEVGAHFRLAPLLRAEETCAPYGVALIERGKARGFQVRGSDISEVENSFTATDVNAHAENSRTGWSHHVDGHFGEKVRSFDKDLGVELRSFSGRQHSNCLVIGCREDVWSELEPELPREVLATVAGHFHLASFDLTPAEVLTAARPLFDQHLRQRCDLLVREISENPSRRAAGVRQVLRSLQEGRVQKLLLGKVPGHGVSECKTCGYLQFEAGSACGSCGSLHTSSVAVEESLIRLALLSDAEILSSVPGDLAGFNGVAGLLRY